MTDSLRPHESQHARPPCPLQTLRVYPNSCPSSQWCHPAISGPPYSFSSPLLLSLSTETLSQGSLGSQILPLSETLQWQIFRIWYLNSVFWKLYVSYSVSWDYEDNLSFFMWTSKRVLPLYTNNNRVLLKSPSSFPIPLEAMMLQMLYIAYRWPITWAKSYPLPWTLLLNFLILYWTTKLTNLKLSFWYLTVINSPAEVFPIAVNYFIILFIYFIPNL